MVKPDCSVYHEARRLLSFLKNFDVCPPKNVPPASILREFIGQLLLSETPGNCAMCFTFLFRRFAV